MKKILFSLLLLSFLSTTVMAQQPMRATSDNRNKEMRDNKKDDHSKHLTSATEAAKAQTQQMKTLLQLSDSQCRKIYPILLHNNQNDSIMNVQIKKMHKDQKNRYKNQNEEIKKILTPEQQAAMMAMPAFAGGPEGNATSWTKSDKKHNDMPSKSDKKESKKSDYSREKARK